MRFSTFYPLIGFAVFHLSTLSAQTILEPEIGEVEFAKIQATDGSDGSEAAHVLRTMRAVVPAGEEVWISLGHFEFGEFHRLIVSAHGHSALSNAEVTFASSWNGGAPNVRTLNQYNAQGRFRLYYRPAYRLGSGRGLKVFMKYKNVSPAANTIRAEHHGVHYNSWREDAVTLEDINDATEMKGKIEIQSGYANYPDYNLIRGTYLNDNVSVTGSLQLNGESVLTTSSLNTLTPNGIGIGGPAPSNGIRVRRDATIASSNLENGSIIVQDGAGVGKLAIDSNELVASHNMNYTTLTEKTFHRFQVREAGAHREVIADFGLLDQRSHGMQIGNATFRDGKFLPNLTGYSNDPSVGGLSLTGAVQLPADRIGVPVIEVNARTYTRPGEPTASSSNVYGPVNNRNLLRMRNHSKQVALISNNGQTTLTNTAWKADPDKNYATDAGNDYGEALVVEGNATLYGSLDIASTAKDMPNVRVAQGLGTAEYYGPVKTGVHSHKVDFVFRRASSATSSYVNLPIGALGLSSQVKITATCVNANLESAEFTLVGSRHRTVKCVHHRAYGAAQGFSIRAAMHHSHMILWLDYSDEVGDPYASISEIRVSAEFQGGSSTIELELDPVYREDLGFNNHILPVEMIDSLIVSKSESQASNQLGVITDRVKNLQADLNVDGDLTIQGEFKLAQPQGDISMGIFGE